MAQLFEQYLVLTDLDGTVVDEALNILPRDIEAISYFIANGGTFGVSTGRVMVSAMPLVRRLPTNAPCVFLNGGAIMDPHTAFFCTVPTWTKAAGKRCGRSPGTFRTCGPPC